MLKKIILGLVLTIALLTIGGYAFLKSTAPDYEGTLSLAGLESSVDVKFDNFGIPHIYAQSSQDCYYALGYVHAQDRLFQMEMIRRLASGRLAEILGPDMVDADKYFRTLGVRHTAEATVEALKEQGDPKMKAQVNAYLSGVNEFLHHGQTPLEFSLIGIPKEDFTEADIYTVLGYMGLGFTLAIKEEPMIDYIARHLGPEYLEDWEFTKQAEIAIEKRLSEREALSSFEAGTQSMMDKAQMPIWYGSNGWVVSPQKSKSGKVIFANDTHIGISQPSVWYEAHLNYPGYEFYGSYLAGVPYAVLGHSRDLSYGLTIFPVDMLDMYRERKNPENPNQLWVDDHWQEMDRRTENIKIKDNQSIEYEVKSSRHGPILNEVLTSLENEEEPISLWWNYHQKPTSTIAALFEMNHAKSIEDTRRGVQKIDFIGLNVLYGDREGNIAHWAAGRVPKRPLHVSGKSILDGASGADKILGYYDWDEQPHQENPASGYVASANNDPGYEKAYMPGYYCPDNRINRIRMQLESQEKWSQEEMKSIQLDEISDMHKGMSSLMSNIIIAVSPELSDQDLSIVGKLRNWDGGYRMDQIEPTIFSKLVYNVMRSAMEDEVGQEMYDALQPSYLYKGSVQNILSNPSSIWWDDIRTITTKEARNELVVGAFIETIEDLKRQLGNDPSKWTWNRVHTIEHVHPIGRKKPFDKIFNVGPFEHSGGNDVPNKMMYKVDSTGLYKTTSSPAIRILVDFANVEASESINPTGQSGNVMSAHYSDQAEMFINGVYRPQLMNHEQIARESRVLKLVKK